MLCLAQVSSLHIMKKHIKSLVIVLCTIVSFFTGIQQVGAQANVIVQKNVVLNGVASSTTATTPETVFVSPLGATGLNNFGVAYEIMFMHPTTGVPINVQDFKVLSATHTLQKEGVNTTWVNILAGSYNPSGDSSRPDFVVRNTSGTQTSVNLTPVVGTVVPSAHKFQVLDFNVSLGTSARPKLVSAGQNYTLMRNISFEYKYLNTLYTKTLSEQVRVEVVSLPQVMDMTEGFVLRFQVSDNLEDWFPVNTPLPNPFPDSIEEIIALLPAEQTVSGLVRNDRRFYRFSIEPAD